MVDLAEHLDELRITAGRAEALAAVAVSAYDDLAWDEPDALLIERVAHLIGATHEATSLVMLAVDHFLTVVADAQPAEGGDQRDGEGTSSDK